MNDIIATTANVNELAWEIYNQGFNILPTQYGKKGPRTEWKKFQTEHMKAKEFQALFEKAAEGLWMLMGVGGLRVFDIDAPKDENNRPLYKVPGYVLNMALESLGLPDDYPWAWRSGSGAGWGIAVVCHDKVSADSLLGRVNSDESGVFEGQARPGLEFDHLELRWQRCGTKMVGGHPTGPGYSWLNGEPHGAPVEVLGTAIIRAWGALVDDSQHRPESKALTTLSPNGHSPIHIEQTRDLDIKSVYVRGLASQQVTKFLSAHPGHRHNASRDCAVVLSGLYKAPWLDDELRQYVAACGEQLRHIAALAGDDVDKVAKTIEDAWNYAEPAIELNWLRLAVTASTVGEVEPPPTLSLNRIMAREFPKLNWRVENLIASNHSCMVGGRPKIGKSINCLEMACAIASGEPFLGMKTQPGKVLYIAREDGWSRIQYRLWQRKRSLELSVWFWIDGTDEDGQVMPRMAPLNDEQGRPGPGIQQMREAAAEFDVIFLDTFRRSLTGKAVENDNNIMAELGYALLDIAHEQDTAIVIVHHLTKRGQSTDPFDDLRGGGAIRGAYDAGIIVRVEHEATENEQLVLYSENRDTDTLPILLEVGEFGIWHRVQGEKEMLALPSGQLDTMKAVLRLTKKKSAGVTVDEVNEERNVSPQTVSKQLNMLLKRGYVERTTQKSTVGRGVDLWKPTKKTVAWRPFA